MGILIALVLAAASAVYPQGRPIVEQTRHSTVVGVVNRANEGFAGVVITDGRITVEVR